MISAKSHHRIGWARAARFGFPRARTRRRRAPRSNEPIEREAKSGAVRLDGRRVGVMIANVAGPAVAGRFRRDSGPLVAPTPRVSRPTVFRLQGKG